MTTTLRKNATLALLLTFLSSSPLFAQLQVDTIAYQDFEVAPASPIWTYTGVLADVQSGNALPTACIPNTPLGINSSQAWHVVSVSGGNPIIFDNTVINPGYDSIRANFKLAGLNLNGATGGPDDLDYVLVEYSLDNGVSWVGRLRIRGSLANNSFWAYDATGVAAVQHLPASEAVFQATTTGLQVAEGYSFCEISFPGNITQLALRITPRSSSASDSWLVDDLVLTGEFQCSPSASSISEVSCNSYTSPSGIVYTSSAIFNDTIPNAIGCDSIINIDLTINNSSTSSISEISCDSYTSPSGTVYANSAIFDDTIPNTVGCDSIISINLTVNNSTTSSISDSGLDIYTAPSGATYTTGGIYIDTIQNAVGCDSVITIDLVMNYTGLDALITSNISIFPNPVKDFVTIKGLPLYSEIQSIAILDLIGSQIKEIPPSESTLNVSSLPSGFYFIYVVHVNGTNKIKFLKE